MGSTTLPSHHRHSPNDEPPSRAVETALRSGNGANNAPFPSSKAAKSPPGSLQESAFSPLTQGRLTWGDCLRLARRRDEGRISLDKNGAEE